MSAPLLLAGAAVLAAAVAARNSSAATDWIVSVTPNFTRWDAEIRAASRRHSVPWRWIKAIMWNESSLGNAPSVARGLASPNDAEASKSGDGKSWGLMQVTLTTARELRPEATTALLNDPAFSIDVGARYLAKMLTRFKGDRDKAVRAYNGGPGYASTAIGPAATALYLERFKAHLLQVLQAQPGSETEIG